jgi:hypothetical protein
MLRAQNDGCPKEAPIRSIISSAQQTKGAASATPCRSKSLFGMKCQPGDTHVTGAQVPERFGITTVRNAVLQYSGNQR